MAGAGTAVMSDGHISPFAQSRPETGAGRLRRYAIIATAIAMAAPLVAAALVSLFSKGDPAKHKQVVQISLITPAPPPPPPPRPPEEQPRMREEVKLDQPKPDPVPKDAPSAPPPGPLGLDAAGTGPGDGFGLAGRPGGRDIIASAGGGMSLTLFGTSTARHIAQELSRDERLKGARYSIEIRVWLSTDGRFEREEILRGSGDRELDEHIREGLKKLGAIRQGVPENLPQPLRIRVTSADA